MNKNHIFMVITIIFALYITSCKNSTEMIETENKSFSKTISYSKTKADSLYVKFDIDFPVKTADKAVLKSIQTTLLQQLFGDNYIKMDISEAIVSYYEELLTEYKIDYEASSTINEEENSTEYPYTFYNNEHILNAHIISSVDNIISYSIERYLYTGGAHGINTRIFLNFDMRDGSIINDENLYINGYDTKLIHILISSLIDQNNDIQLISDLKESDYEIDAIKPNNNFYISEEGITYVYNPYEIAPYALGETEIFISADTIKPYLKPEWQIFE